MQDGSIPSAHDWFDRSSRVVGRAGHRSAGEYQIVYEGDLSSPSFRLTDLRPGDIISNGHHVGVYVPRGTRGGASHMSGYSDSQITQSQNLADGEAVIRGQSISAATMDGDHPDPVLGWTGRNGGVHWGGWGFRLAPGEDHHLVVRRFVPYPQ